MNRKKSATGVMAWIMGNSKCDTSCAWCLVTEKAKGGCMARGGAMLETCISLIFIVCRLDRIELVHGTPDWHSSKSRAGKDRLHLVIILIE